MKDQFESTTPALRVYVLIALLTFSALGWAAGPGAVEKRVESVDSEWKVQSANALTFQGEADSFTIRSRAMMRGTKKMSGPEETIAARRAQWGSLEIKSPRNLAEQARNRLDLDDGRWIDAAAASLDTLLSNSLARSITPIELSVLFLPFDYKYDKTVRSKISDGLKISLVVGYNPSTSVPAPQHFSEVVQLIYHEILHATLSYNKRKPISDINEEAAAVVVGYCGMLEYADNLNASLMIALKLNNDEIYLNRQNGIKLEPRKDVLMGMDPSIAGQGLGSAALVAKFGDSFETTSKIVVSELKPACASILEGTIPDIISGEFF